MTSARTVAPSVRDRQLDDALHIGLAAQLLVLLMPVVDWLTFDSIATHVRAAYPAWGPGEVALDHDAIVWSLLGVGLLGSLGWLWAIRTSRRAGHRSRIITTALFALGTTVAVTSLLFAGGAYDRVLPLWYGIAGIVPCLAGLTAVVAVWQPGRAGTPGAPAGWARG